MKRIAWLAAYDVNLLEPQLKLSRHKISHASSWIVNLSAALAKRSDVDLHVVTCSQLVSRDQFIEKGNIKFHVMKTGIPFTSRGYPSFFPLDMLTCFRFEAGRLARKINAIRPDVVHAHGTEDAYGLAGIRSGYPCLVSIQGIITEYFKTDPNFRFRIVRRLEQDVVKRGSYFACRTSFDSGFVRSYNPQAKIFTLNEAVNPEYYKSPWRGSDSKIVLFVGGICKRKGVEVLIRAVDIARRSCPEISLVLIGNGCADYVRYLKKLCAELGIERRVDFAGFKSHDQIAQYHVRSRLLALPTENDNSPNSVLEAMVSGLPVVATNVGGLASLVSDGKTGILVGSRSPEKFAQAIVDLFRNPQLCEEISRNSRESSRQKLHPDSVASAAVDIYNEMIRCEREKIGTVK